MPAKIQAAVQYQICVLESFT